MSDNIIPASVERGFDIIQDTCEYVMVVLLVLMTVLASLQILIRFILSDFGVSAVWTEQLSRYLLVLLTFIGAPYAMRTNDNISIRPLLERAPPIAQRVLVSVSNVLVVVFAIFVILSVTEVLPRSINVPLSNFRSLTVGYAHIVLAAAFVMVLLYAVEETIDLWEMDETELAREPGIDSDEEELAADFGGDG